MIGNNTTADSATASTFFKFFYYTSMCIIVNSAGKRRTPNVRFRARRADHSSTSMCDLPDLISAVKCMWLDFRTMNMP